MASFWDLAHSCRPWSRTALLNANSQDTLDVLILTMLPRSFFPRHLHYTLIPVNKNAQLLEPDTPNGRWPTVIFSHGLGGGRNTYSHLAGSLASHGVVVICPEHRDGSSVITFVRVPGAQDRFFIRNRRRVVPYTHVPHVETPETWAMRDHQLRIRLWELGLVHQAVLALNSGCQTITNMNLSTPKSSMEQFRDLLHVNEPGSIIWAGHSFGAATITQLLKSTYYAADPEVRSMEKPLFLPDLDCSLRRQITPRSITMLLDMWCFPLQSPDTTALFRRPLPVYADEPTAPGGAALLAVESQAFFDWTEHMHLTARLLSPDPSAPVVSPALFQRPRSGVRQPEPYFFYVESSAHLNQSDFGVLFPLLTRRIFKATAPERVLRLNLRAQLQLLRINGVPVARTWFGDLVEGAHVGKFATAAAASESDSHATRDAGRATQQQDAADDDMGRGDCVNYDSAIFARGVPAMSHVADHGAADTSVKAGPVECWHWIDIVGMGIPPAKGQKQDADDAKDAVAQVVGDSGADDDAVYREEDGASHMCGQPGVAIAGERSMEGEIVPHLATDRSHRAAVDVSHRLKRVGG